MVEVTTRSAPTRRPPAGPERLLVVRCPRWPLVALGAEDGAPVAVAAGGVIVAASSTAAAEGVRPGLRRRDAEAACPGLAVLARDLPAERRAFEPVLRLLEGLGVPVTVRAPGWAGLPVRGPARRHGGEAGLVAAVGGALEHLGPPAPASTSRRGAPGGGAARSTPTGPPLGRAPVGERWWRIGVADGHLAASLAAWRGLVVPPGEAASFLAPFPVEHLGDPRLTEVLRRLGIETLGAFAALDPGDLGARFGRDALTLQALAAGREPRQPAGRPSEPPPVEAERRLDPPTSQLEAALFVARGLADELTGWLRHRGLACRLLAIQVELGDGSRLERRWSGPASCSPSLVVERLRAQLEGLARAEGQVEEEIGAGGAEVAVVRLVALEVAADGGDQRSLWDRRRSGDDERVARAAARLEGLLGPGAVVRVATGGGRGPAERTRRFAFDEPPPPPPPPAPWPGRLPPPNPAVVPAVPLPATVLDAGGATVGVDGRGALSAPPARVAVAGGPGRAVTAYAGPFPADERWWEAGGHRRRARLQVVVAGGAAYLLALERGAWSLEGVYD